MKQNEKKQLKEALKYFTNHTWQLDSNAAKILKAAQAYADLPEKIERMKDHKSNLTLVEIVKSQKAFIEGKNQALDDILNLLKEEV